MNTCHHKKKFTVKKEQNYSFNFLDVKVIKEDKVFPTSVYRKPSFSDFYTHFDSYMPLTCKFSLVSTIIFRNFTICTDMPKFHQEKMVTVKGFLTNVLKHSSIKYLFLNEYIKLLKRNK